MALSQSISQSLFVIKTQDNEAGLQHLVLPKKETQMTNIKLWLKTYKLDTI